MDLGDGCVAWMMYQCLAVMPCVVLHREVLKAGCAQEGSEGGVTHSCWSVLSSVYPLTARCPCTVR